MTVFSPEFQLSSGIYSFLFFFISAHNANFVSVCVFCLCVEGLKSIGNCKYCHAALSYQSHLSDFGFYVCIAVFQICICVFVYLCIRAAFVIDSALNVN